MSAPPPRTDVKSGARHVRFVPEAEVVIRSLRRLARAMSAERQARVIEQFSNSRPVRICQASGPAGRTAFHPSRCDRHRLLIDRKCPRVRYPELLTPRFARRPKL